MLDLTNDNRNIAFIITNSNWTEASDGTQLIVTVKLQYPVYCSSMCSDALITELYTTLLSTSKIKDFTYTKGTMTYKIYKLDFQGAGRSVPLSILMLSYPIESTANITEGPITDEASLTNIKHGIEESLDSSTEIEILRASFVPVTTSTAKALPVERRLRRERQKKYVLVVIIRFIFIFSTCDRRCQQSTLMPIIDHIRPPPKIIIIGIAFILPKPTIRTSIKFP
ncbi:unnamed protein product [Rotaria sp. Silwood2]|nr:unnamed protein product [Rotaria sp. Silwood2]CAF4305412.1 unnamed protein product [Rotaria sp. Silwood2]